MDVVADRALIARIERIITDGPPEAVAQEMADYLVGTVTALVGDPDGPAAWIETHTVPEATRWLGPATGFDTPTALAA